MRGRKRVGRKVVARKALSETMEAISMVKRGGARRDGERVKMKSRKEEKQALKMRRRDGPARSFLPSLSACREIRPSIRPVRAEGADDEGVVHALEAITAPRQGEHESNEEYQGDS